MITPSSKLKKLYLCQVLAGTGILLASGIPGDPTGVTTITPRLLQESLLGGILIGSVFFLLQYWFVIRPLRAMKAVAETLKNAPSDKVDDFHSHDILGDIATDYLGSVRSLYRLLPAIEEKIQQLHQTATQLDQLTENVSADSQSQRAHVGNITDAIGQITDNSHEITRHIEATANTTQASDEHSETAKVVVVEAMSSVDVLADMVTHATDVINHLEKESENIGNVLSVISGIAEQTNLLALNAAIEAARAGEQGRGFAVVADEVRTLATRTQKATQEISTMIDNLQTGSHKAVETMIRGRDQAAKGVEYTEQAAEALAEISGNLSTIKTMSGQIVDVNVEQNRVIEEINRNICEINQVSSQTADNMQQVNISSHRVSEFAGELNDLLTRFR